MSRVVVRIAGEIGEDGRETVKFSLDQAPADIPNPGQLYRFQCKADAVLALFNQTPPSSDVVKRVGEQLLQKLILHPAVGRAIDAALDDGSGVLCPIYLRLSSEEAAAFPWETLFDQRKEFLALDGRWPIARITDMLPTEQDVRYFSPPLRLLAALSATGIDARPQWEHLRNAVLNAALDVRLRVIVGQPGLCNDIKHEIRLLGDQRLSAVPLASKSEFLDQVSDFDPHILHVFSHGRGDYGPRLELATPQDHSRKRSSVLVEPGELRGLTQNTWLVVLNCCRGGADTPGIRSLAYMVVGAGYPAVVGMREPITDSDGHLVTRSYYPGLLDRLAKLLLPGGIAEIDWAADLHRPRQELRDKYLNGHPGETADPLPGPAQLAARYRDWSVPVLYVRPEPLRVECIQVHPRLPPERMSYLASTLNEMSRARLALHAATPAAALREIDGRIEEIKRELRDGQ